MFSTQAVRAARVMAWMRDVYSMHPGYPGPGGVTGKPISLGGSEGRNEATARGTIYCIIEAARHLGPHDEHRDGRLGDPGKEGEHRHDRRFGE